MLQWAPKHHSGPQVPSQQNTAENNNKQLSQRATSEALRRGGDGGSRPVSPHPRTSTMVPHMAERGGHCLTEHARPRSSQAQEQSCQQASCDAGGIQPNRRSTLVTYGAPANKPPLRNMRTTPETWGAIVGRIQASHVNKNTSQQIAGGRPGGGGRWPLLICPLPHMAASHCASPPQCVGCHKSQGFS
jgi:hypothetical protein